MILGFLGKGGSGKSSVSSQMTLFLNQNDKSVLAIDADHNMDLSYNLAEGSIPEVDYLSHSLDDLRHAVGLSNEEKYSQVFLRDRQEDVYFSLTPLSPEIERYSAILTNSIRLMIAGPQTNNVLFGTHCSHSLTTPLKILLPLLKLQENENVVVDEKAGADGVTTGIVTGIDVGVIVCEPALHSIKTAKQIAELMEFYGTPYVFVGNKVSCSEDREFIHSELGREPITFLMESSGIKRNPSVLVREWTDELKVIFDRAGELNQNNRLERTKSKFKRNHEFAHQR